jgi:uncharacterized Fe-S cluster-containing radical SAM superfamily protein
MCIFCAANFSGNSLNKVPDLNKMDFQRILTQLCAEPGDHIIVNGGEPTVHDNFFDFLTIIKDFGAVPTLFTNGLNLNDSKFVRRIAEFEPIDIRIPFFGASPEKHDVLTGGRGNFNRTYAGFANVVQLIEEGRDIQLSAKLLLSKATSAENIEIAHLLMSRFEKSFYFSLNPLIISPKVMENKDLLIESFSGMKADTENTIDYITISGFDIEMLLLPFCVLDKKYTDLLLPECNAFPEYYYFDPQYSEENLEHAVPFQSCSEKCQPCVYNRMCRGFYPEYLEIFGTDEIKPVKLTQHGQRSNTEL